MIPCLGCGRSIPDVWRLCEWCHEEALENLACHLDPAYNRAALNTGERLWQALRPVYFDWDTEYLPPKTRKGAWGALLRAVECGFERERVLLKPT